jgi:hypothetical protein
MLIDQGKSHQVTPDGSSLLELPLEPLQPRFEVHIVVASLDGDALFWFPGTIASDPAFGF